MELNVSQLLKSPVGTTQDYEVSGMVDISDGSDSLVQGEVKLVRTDRSILVKGSLHTEVEVSCSRCLNLFNYSLRTEIEEEYFPTTDVNTGASLAAPDEPGCFTIDENHILDLSEAMRQYSLLAIPMKPLCRENCAGICPTCGQDLNQGACHCPAKRADPRWSKLRELASNSNASLSKKRETR